MSSTFSVSVITIFISVFAAVAAVYGAWGTSNPSLKHILSYVALLVPCLCILLMYVNAIIMRKVAIYRGYCARIEKELSEIIRSKNINYHGELINNYLASHCLSNTIGSLFLFVVLGMFLTGSFAFSAIIHLSDGFFWWIWGSVLLVSLIIITFSIIDLEKNNTILKEIQEK